ncbi:MAG: DegT/DnrJ/EryC1/StrS family aminotransferase [Pyrinomonadaceae bacterium]|nr:DegT/DnrJ/EryC1/StrS family aminotransferase [Pyrinomonadaceae bacterium]
MIDTKASAAIPILDLKQQYVAIQDEINTAIQGVLESTQFVLGPAVNELERRVAAYCECQHGVGVASGTDALRLSLAALEIGPGDEVITTPFTFVATANTISHSGAKPVFVDIEPGTYNLDPAAVEDAITPRTKAIMPVHLYGQSAEMDTIMDVAERYGLKIIEDCAQAIGARYKGKRLGSIGHIGCLSFFPSKNLGAYGDAGMVVTNDEGLAEKIDVLRRQGGHKKYYHEVLGFNSRLDTLQAAILNVKLNYLEQWNEGRRTVAHRYNDLLSDMPVVTPYESPDSHHVYHQYTIRSPQRDELASHLKEHGVSTMIYYPIPLHHQQLYAEMSALHFPNAELAGREVLSLPIFPELTERDQEFIADTIRGFFDGR